MSDPMDRQEVEQFNTQEWDDDLSEDEREAAPKLARVLLDKAEWSWDDWQYWCRSEEPMTATELLRIWDVLP